MAKVSAGILLYRRRAGVPEVLLVHPGGPFWKNKDDGAWFLPKGELEPGEEPESAARREFAEELGHAPPEGELAPLGTVRNKGGKLIHGFALEGEIDTQALNSSTFSVEWPPRSGKLRDFPEVDRAQFFGMEEGARKLHAAEQPFLERLLAQLVARP